MWTESQIGVSGWLLTGDINMLDTLEAINERAAQLKPGERFEIRGLPSEIYHAADGYGSTAVREATRSMAHFWTYLHTPRTQSRDVTGLENKKNLTGRVVFLQDRCACVVYTGKKGL